MCNFYLAFLVPITSSNFLLHIFFVWQILFWVTAEWKSFFFNASDSVRTTEIKLNSSVKKYQSLLFGLHSVKFEVKEKLRKIKVRFSLDALRKLTGFLFPYNSFHRWCFTYLRGSTISRRNILNIKSLSPAKNFFYI